MPVDSKHVHIPQRKPKEGDMVRVFVGDLKHLARDREKPFMISRYGRVVAQAAQIEFDGPVRFRFNPQGLRIRDQKDPNVVYIVHAYVEWRDATATWGVERAQKGVAARRR